MHDACVTKHKIELALGDGDEANVEDVSEHQDKQERVELRGELRRKDGSHQTQDAVKAELLEHAGVQHRGRSRGRRIGLRSPRVKRKERNKNPKAQKKHEINTGLRLGRARCRELRDSTHVKGALIRRQT